jgi:predicted  nucleic acid-binding Zn-ribbon protein
MNEAEKIEELEKKLDAALAKVFELESQQKRDGMIRYELEEFVRSIYYECRNLLEEESEVKPSLDKVLGNLSENIRKMARDYHIDL